MNDINYYQNVLYEHRFWLQILGDHARFIYNAASPDEQEVITKAARFINIFDNLNQQSRRNLTTAELHLLNLHTRKNAEDIRNFKLHLIRRHLSGNI